VSRCVPVSDVRRSSCCPGGPRRPGLRPLEATAIRAAGGAGGAPDRVASAAMHTLSGLQSRLLTSIVTVGLAVGLAACGGSSKPAASGPSGSGGDSADDGVGGGRVMAPGTSGLPGLDWGATADAVMALYPRGTANEAGVVAIGMTDGHQSLTQFSIGATGLTQVDIEWVEGYISMEECLKGWAEVRTKVDERLGASTSDNGAAYWELPAASVTLACNPNDIDNGSAVLSQTFAQRKAE